MRQQAMPFVIASLFVLINALFFWLSYPEMPNVAQHINTDRWALQSSVKSSPTEMSLLLDGGFWGKKTTESARAQNTAGQKQDEAKVLRQKIRAIVGNEKKWQVLFQVDEKYHRFQKGDKLPGTKWKLQAIYADKLDLTEDGKEVRRLNIYSEDSLVDVSAKSNLSVDKSEKNATSEMLINPIQER